MNGNEIRLIILKAMLYIIYAEVIVGALILVFIIILMLCMHRNGVNFVSSTDLSRIEMRDNPIAPMEVLVEGASRLSSSPSQGASNLGSYVAVGNEEELQERILEGFSKNTFGLGDEGELGRQAEQDELSELDKQDELVEPVGTTEPHSNMGIVLRKESGTLCKKNVPKEK